jgi:1,5-anhydro-D-fructose reductase (1,5-anhydro-D-mannitol-forming)
LDLSGEANWRTEKHVALGGYFDDLASHGLDLFAYLLGEYDQVEGIGINQQNLYSSLDAVTACWSHYGGVTGCGSWNFGAYDRQDSVVISGSEGLVKFSVFEEAAILVCTEQGEQELFVENPVNIQFHHVDNMASQLFAGHPHPSTGASATHTAWVMDRILGRSGS